MLPTRIPMLKIVYLVNYFILLVNLTTSISEIYSKAYFKLWKDKKQLIES